MNFLIKNILIAKPQGLFPGSVLFNKASIVSVYSVMNDQELLQAVQEDLTKNKLDSQEVSIIDGNGGILSPGFIDTHCHGGNNADVNDASLEALRKIGLYHAQNGTTSWTPSLSVDPLPVLTKTLTVIDQFTSENTQGRITSLGAHFESPWISLAYKGCQASERILPFDTSAQSFIKDFASVIKRITIAPELPGMLDFIPTMCSLGITVSGGHSEASSAIFKNGADQGMTMVTHVYNAMSSVKKVGPFRQTGVLEVALTDDRLFAEFICDGFHVPTELIDIARRCKGLEKFMICSDANRGAGVLSGTSIITCGQEAIIENGVSMTKDRSSLASSVTPLSGMVRFLVQKVGVPIHEALYAASAIPAKAMGVFVHKGSIEKGKDADLVLLDASLQVKTVWCGGVKVS